MRIKNRLIVKLVFYYTLLVILAFGSIFAFVSISYSKHILMEKENVYEQKTDILAEQLNTAIRKIYTIHSEANKNIQHLNEEENDSILNSLRAKYTGIRSVYLYDASGRLLSYAADSLAAIPEFTELNQFISSKAYRHFSLLNDDLVYFGSLYVHSNTAYQYDYYIAIVINKNRFFYNLVNDALFSFDGICVTDGREMIMQNGQNISFSYIESISKNSKVNLNGKKFMLFKQRNRVYSEWFMVNLLDYSSLSKDITQLAFLFGVIACLCILLIMIISFFISRQITHPLFQVNQAMREVEQGLFPPPLHSSTSDETHELITGFNHMVSSLKKLNEDIAKEQEEIRQYEVRQVKIQLDLLQSQINPHFIHNTLNTLKYMALSENNIELANTITSFNALLRASISSNTEYCTTEEECYYVQQYMNIQKKRYSSHNIECVIHVDDTAAQALLPRLILQPLVENSLMHGILPLAGRDGIIRILCFVQNQFLNVYISDNGVGISEENIAKLNRGELRVTNGYNHIGINNVKDRLNIMYKTDCKFIISSDVDSGTTIYFCVPYKEVSDV